MGQLVGWTRNEMCVLFQPLKPWGKKGRLGISGVGHCGIGCLCSFWKCFVCSALSALRALIWFFFSSYTSVDQGMWGNVSIGSPSTGGSLGRPVPRKAGIIISTLLLWVKIPCLAKTLCIWGSRSLLSNLSLLETVVMSQGALLPSWAPVSGTGKWRGKNAQPLWRKWHNFVSSIIIKIIWALFLCYPSFLIPLKCKCLEK